MKKILSGLSFIWFSILVLVSTANGGTEPIYRTVTSNSSTVLYTGNFSATGTYTLNFTAASSGQGFATNVGGGTAVTVTYFPSMTTANDAAGEGTSGGISAGYLVNGGVGWAKSGVHKGVSVSAGIGASWLPVEYHQYWTNTTLEPMNAAGRREARTMLQDFSNKLENNIKTLKTKQTELAGKKASLEAEGLELYKKSKSARGAEKNKIEAQYKANINQRNEVDKELNTLNEDIKKQEDVKGKADQAIQKLK